MRNLVSLCQNGGPCLLQDLRARHVGNFSRIVGIFDTATRFRQVVYGVAQVGDSGVETVLYRTQVRTQRINLCQRSIDFLQRVFGGCSSRFRQFWLCFKVVTFSFAGIVGFTVDSNNFGFAVYAAKLVQCRFSVAVFISVRSSINTETTVFFWVAA